ncbi:MAG: 4-(cytidine 5'-diphospho)-2-C-methyl-D-erythritol kinase [Bacteroidota bacterium]
MIAFPNCKINLGLRVLQKRSDGFHNIETIFYPVPLKDTLEIVSVHTTTQTPGFYSYGLPIPGEPSANLCIKAWQLLKTDFPGLPPVDIHLLKNIPIGAGLGGGSADAACMLRLLNTKFNLGISAGQLQTYALQLGSDCPFFLVNIPSYATGRGEQLEPILVDLSSWQLALAHPGIHIPTAWAFCALDINNGAASGPALSALVATPIKDWKQHLLNDFEKPVFEKYPEIKSVKEDLYQLGAVYASMTGSGSTVFGLFEPEKNLAPILPAHYRLVRL